MRLQRQLEQRRVEDERRKKRTLIASIAATLVLIAAVIIVIVVATGGDDKAPAAAPGCASPPAGAVCFQNVLVTNPTQTKTKPATTSTGTADPAKLEYKDLVVGTGTTATPKSAVKVQYLGELYRAGTTFDSSWDKGGQPVSFSLTGVVPGFTQGIGGTTGVPAMKVGGRRIIIMPAALGYGAAGNGSVPPNAALVFVVDLTSVS